MRELTENCVVCKKYLKDIGEQENAMCDKCNRVTYKIAKEIDSNFTLDEYLEETRKWE